MEEISIRYKFKEAIIIENLERLEGIIQKSTVLIPKEFREKRNFDEIAENISKAMNFKGYVKICIDDNEYIIFKDKIFKYTKKDKEAKRRAQEYAKSLDIS